jgi:hypothetical protein
MEPEAKRILFNQIDDAVHHCNNIIAAYRNMLPPDVVDSLWLLQGELNTIRVGLYSFNGDI